jgi:hypothetical protein
LPDNRTLAVNRIKPHFGIYEQVNHIQGAREARLILTIGKNKFRAGGFDHAIAKLYQAKTARKGQFFLAGQRGQ